MMYINTSDKSDDEGTEPTQIKTNSCNDSTLRWQEGSRHIFEAASRPSRVEWIGEHIYHYQKKPQTHSTEQNSDGATTTTTTTTPTTSPEQQQYVNMFYFLGFKKDGVQYARDSYCILKERTNVDGEEQQTVQVVQIRSVYHKMVCSSSSLSCDVTNLISNSFIMEVRVFAWPYQLSCGARSYHTNQTVVRVSANAESSNIKYIDLDSPSLQLMPCLVLSLRELCKRKSTSSIFYYIDSESAVYDEKSNTYELIGLDEQNDVSIPSQERILKFIERSPSSVPLPQEAVKLPSAEIVESEPEPEPETESEVKSTPEKKQIVTRTQKLKQKQKAKAKSDSKRKRTTQKKDIDETEESQEENDDDSYREQESEEEDEEKDDLPRKRVLRSTTQKTEKKVVSKPQTKAESKAKTVKILESPHSTIEESHLRRSPRKPTEIQEQRKQNLHDYSEKRTEKHGRLKKLGDSEDLDSADEISVYEDAEEEEEENPVAANTTLDSEEDNELLHLSPPHNLKRVKFTPLYTEDAQSLEDVTAQAPTSLQSKYFTDQPIWKRVVNKNPPSPSMFDKPAPAIVPKLPPKKGLGTSLLPPPVTSTLLPTKKIEAPSTDVWARKLDKFRVKQTTNIDVDDDIEDSRAQSQFALKLKSPLKLNSSDGRVSTSSISQTLSHMRQTVGAALARNSPVATKKRKTERQATEVLILDDADLPLMARIKLNRGERPTKEDFLTASDLPTNLDTKSPRSKSTKSRQTTKRVQRKVNSYVDPNIFDEHESEDAELEQKLHNKRKLSDITDSYEDSGERPFDVENDEDLEDFVVDDDADLGYYDEEDEDDESNDESEGDDNENSSVDQSIDSFMNNIKAFKSPVDAFKRYVQFLVSCQLQPDFHISIEEEQDSYFRPAINSVERYVNDRKELMIRSTIWEAHFKQQLETRPEYRSFSGEAFNNCQACLRSNHPATWKVCLCGDMYDYEALMKHNTLVILPQEDDDSVPKQRGVNGEVLTHQSKFLLGRHCHARTKLFHQMHHFKYHIWKKISEKLEKCYPEEMQVLRNNNEQNSEQESSLESDRITEMCMRLLDDASWMSNLQNNFQQLIHSIDRFNSSTNATNE